MNDLMDQVQRMFHEEFARCLLVKVDELRALGFNDVAIARGVAELFATMPALLLKIEATARDLAEAHEAHVAGTATAH